MHASGQNLIPKAGLHSPPFGSVGAISCGPVSKLVDSNYGVQGGLTPTSSI